jgi:hypothetical protein
MNEFKTPPDFSTTTVANPRDSGSVILSPWSSQGGFPKSFHQIIFPFWRLGFSFLPLLCSHILFGGRETLD